MDANKFEFIRKLENLLKLGDINIKRLTLCADDIVEVLFRNGAYIEIDVNECTPVQAAYKILERIITIED